jgi:hypothetical protein
MNPETIWPPADAELPVRVNRTIASERHMLILFLTIQGIAHYCWLPKDSTLDSPFFCEEVLCPLAQKMQPNSKKFANPWLWFIWTMQGSTRQGPSKRERFFIRRTPYNFPIEHNNQTATRNSKPHFFLYLSRFFIPSSENQSPFIISDGWASRPWLRGGRDRRASPRNSERKAMKDFLERYRCILHGPRKKMSGYCATSWRWTPDGNFSANIGSAHSGAADNRRRFHVPQFFLP